jgi:hypothetical protein
MAVSHQTGIPLSDVLEGRTVFVDHMGRAKPPEQWHGPGYVYVGELRRGRVCWTTTGTKLKVVAQHEASTTVKPMAGTKKTIGTRTFTASATPYTISRETVVRVSKEKP